MTCVPSGRPELEVSGATLRPWLFRGWGEYDTSRAIEPIRTVGLDHVDVFFVQQPDLTLPAAETAVVLERFVEERLVRWHGPSNHTMEDMVPFADDLVVQTAMVGTSRSAQFDAMAGAGDIVPPDEQRVQVGVAAAGVPVGGPSPEGGVPA